MLHGTGSRAPAKGRNCKGKTVSQREAEIGSVLAAVVVDVSAVAFVEEDVDVGPSVTFVLQRRGALPVELPLTASRCPHTEPGDGAQYVRHLVALPGSHHDVNVVIPRYDVVVPVRPEQSPAVEKVGQVIHFAGTDKRLKDKQHQQAFVVGYDWLKSHMQIC